MQNVFKILITDQETNFTLESKRLIERKIKKQNNGIYSIRKGGGGSDGIQGIRANPFLECQDNQRACSCFFLQTLDLYEGTCGKNDTKENLFLKF